MGLAKSKYKIPDTDWADKVKTRYPKCIWCRSTRRLSADHIFSRKVLATRWDVENGVALCGGCHIFKKRYEPMIWALKVLDLKGQDVIDRLYQKHTGISRKQTIKGENPQ